MPGPRAVELGELDFAEAAFVYYERLGRVRRYVDEHLGDEISLKTAAAIACLEPSYFSVYFRRAVGVPFSEWLRYTQIRAAARLLRESDCSIHEVASHVGLGSVRTFERWFRRLTGVTPRAFSQLHRPVAVRATRVGPGLDDAVVR